MGIKFSLLIVIAIIEVLICFGIFIKNRKSIAHIVFCILLISTSIWTISNSFYFNSSLIKWIYSPSNYYILNSIANIFGALAITLSLVFSLSFPTINTKNFVKVLIFTFIPFFILTTLLLIPHLIVKDIYRVGFEEFKIISSPFVVIYNVYIGLYSLISILVFIFKLRIYGGISKVRFKFILWGCVTAILISSSFNLILPQISKNLSYVWVGPFSSFILIILGTYAIVIYRFIDTKFLINKVIALLIFIIGGLFVCYTTLSVELSLFRDVFNVKAYIVNFFLATIYSLLLISLNSQVVRMEFIKGRYDKSILEKKIKRVLTHEINLEVLVPGFIEAIHYAFVSEKIVVILEDRNKNISSYGDLSNKNLFNIFKIFNKFKLNKNVYVKEELKNKLDFKELKSKGEIELFKFLSDSNLEICIPLYSKNVLQGALFLSPKRRGIYSQQDIFMLLEKCERFSIAVSRGFLYKETVEFNEILSEKILKATDELRLKNNELQKSYNDINEKTRQERDMLDIMGHELRTPATVIKMASYLLEKDLKTQYSKMQIERIKDSIERQIRLINTFINTAKIDNGKMELHVVRYSVEKILKESVYDHKYEAKEKNISIKYIRGKNLPLVYIDVTMIREVIDNLITNAIKYTEEGEVGVSCYMSNNKRSIIVEVKDTGEGISMSDKQVVFKKFKRLHSYTSQIKGDKYRIIRPGGTGLGLYVSKKIVELHKGKIWLNSKIGAGSVFYFSIPLKNVNKDLIYLQKSTSPDMFKRLQLKR